MMLIENGWFYGTPDPRKNARDLMDIYYKTVGRNSVFLMNVPPSARGVIDDEEKSVIEEFTKMRKAVFADNLAAGAVSRASSIRGNDDSLYGPRFMLDGDYDSYFCTDDGVTEAELEFILDGEKTFNRVMLQEYIPLGQRVESFDILVKSGKDWIPWGNGTKSTIGYKRIILGPAVTTGAVKVRIKSALACPVLNGFGLFNDSVSGITE